MRVMVDERMELLTTIQYLADYPILTTADLSYKKELDRYFSSYKSHEAVQLYKQIYERYFYFDGPPTYIYHFSFPDFKQIASISQDDQDAYKFNEHSDTLAMLMASFRKFYHDTRFRDFYAAHKRFYDSLIQPVAAFFAKKDIIKVMEAHYGRQNKQYNIVLSPMLHDGGYGPMIQTPQGNILYAIIGPLRSSTDFPGFDLNSIFSDYVIHEFSHSFCNSLILKNMSRLEKDSCLFTPLRKSIKQQGYGTWQSCLFEHLVRANEIYLTEIAVSKTKAAEAYTNMVEEDKWLYLKGLLPIIRQYAADRKAYRTLEDIMPQIVKYFDREAAACK